MKATGIVRRIDELGRVVIPKEIRRTLRIREGDPLEIFTERETLLLKKYSPMSIIDDIIKNGSFEDIRSILTALIDHIVIDNEDVTIFWRF